MFTLKVVIFLLSLTLVLCQPYVSDRAGCEFNLNAAVLSYLPLLLNPAGGDGNDAFILPDKKATLKFSAKESLEVNCPGGYVTISNVTTNKVSSTVTCSSGVKFQIEKKTVPFDEITCNKYPAHVARFNNKKCLTNYKEVEIGFKLNDGRFLKQIELCYDDNLQTTLYSKFNLTPAVAGSQVNFPRPDFIEGSGFYQLGKHKLNNLYSRYVQRVNINEMLGLKVEDYTYVGKTNDYYLARGHLSAKADFIYGSQHRLTFYYVNVAPQWQTLNAGNWNTMEQNVRDFSSVRNLNLIVYTGTYGITTLPHAKTGQEIELFLYVDGKKRGIPVPRLYWKVVYHPETKAGVALLSINNPYLKNVTRDIVCNNICNKISWLTWNQYDTKLGYSYCCTIADFRKAIPTLPKFTVTKLLT